MKSMFFVAMNSVRSQPSAHVARWRRLVWNPVAVKLSHCFLPRGAFKVVFEQHGFLLENREAKGGGVYIQQAGSAQSGKARRGSPLSLSSHHYTVVVLTNFSVV